MAEEFKVRCSFSVTILDPISNMGLAGYPKILGTQTQEVRRTQF